MDFGSVGGVGAISTGILNGFRVGGVGGHNMWSDGMVGRMVGWLGQTTSVFETCGSFTHHEGIKLNCTRLPHTYLLWICPTNTVKQGGTKYCQPAREQKLKASDTGFLCRCKLEFSSLGETGLAKPEVCMLCVLRYSCQTSGWACQARGKTVRSTNTKY